MRCSRTNAATSKVYTLFSYCILRNGRVRSFCSFRWLFGGGCLPLRFKKTAYYWIITGCVFGSLNRNYFFFTYAICFSATPSSNMYIPVHIWLTSFCLSKNSLLLGTSGIRAASEMYILVNLWTRVSAQYRHGWRADRSETMFHKNLFLWNSQGNLQHGRCKLPKHRCCVKPLPSVAVLKCTSLYICDCEFFQYPVFGQFP